MQRFWQELMVWTTLLGSGLMRFLGGPHEHLEVLSTLMVLDWLAAVGRAVVKAERLSPEVSWRGICRKLLYFVAIAFGHSMDRFFGSGDVIRLVILKLLIATEAVSILNHLGMVDIKLQEWIKRKIEKVGETLKEEPEAEEQEGG